jgi:hypothetical protein
VVKDFNFSQAGKNLKPQKSGKDAAQNAKERRSEIRQSPVNAGQSANLTFP